ncbi:hypothetical protein H1R20_g11975, partial [Candolleomyces eurysporus]
MATAGGLPYNAYDAERAQSPYSSHEKTHEASSSSQHEHMKRPGNSRTPSWDLLGGIKKLEQSYEQFDARNASQAHLIYAEGDTPKNKVSKFYHFLLNVSIVTRWFLFIVPVLGILWIPGILGVTTFPNAKIWAVKLIWWSIWLTVLWGGWWAALAASRVVPAVVRATVGVLAVGTRRYIEWMQVLHRYIALFAWALVLWVTWVPLIKNNQQNPGDKSVKAVDLIAKLLFGFFICAAVLLFEKFSIQWIAGKFHERSYAVKTALESSNRSRILARRIFYSFAKPGADVLLVEDIQRYFATTDEAAQVFALFDKDFNGDATREEMEITLMELHREQLSIENSMRDLDSAVGRLDNIFMTLYVVIAALIIAVALEAQLVTLITGAGTLILGLSWLIGGSLQEVLQSIIFLFIKHPFDVGDRVTINKETYTVKEIRLLSTVFLDGSSVSVQAPNNVLSTMFIQNLRRSPQMSETFTFDVSYATTFEDLEKLRERMLAFVTEERRDYHPSFDVNIKDFPDQSKMTLSVDIKYKANAKRRNKWICALKQALAEVNIYGPSGNPNPPPAVTRYTQVPWESVLWEEQKAAEEKGREQLQHPQPPHHIGGWDLRDKDASICKWFSAEIGNIG